MKGKILVVAAFVLTFAAGVLTGAFIVREFIPPPFPGAPMPREERLPMSLEILQGRLDLSEAQRQQVAEIIGKYQKQLHHQMLQLRPKARRTIQQMSEEIESVLTPEQREKFRNVVFRRMPRWQREATHDSLRMPF
jgi:Spy/CpxP family protein refolding chaperone